MRCASCRSGNPKRPGQPCACCGRACCGKCGRVTDQGLTCSAACARQMRQTGASWLAHNPEGDSEMKSWQMLLLGALAGVGIYLIIKQLAKNKAGTAGFGDYQIPPPPPPWYNLGVHPMPYEPTGWQPHDDWKNFAKRRAELRERGLGEYQPFANYPLAVSMQSRPTAFPFAMQAGPTAFPFAMPYMSSQQVIPMFDDIKWKAPRIDAIHIEDEMEPL